MSPDSYVRGQALVLAGLIIASAVLASPEWGFAIAMISALLASGLWAKYRADVAATQPPPAHRDRLDLIVVGDARAAFAVGLVSSAVLFAFGVASPDIGIAPATPILLAISVAAIYLSSLVDWFVILPRISGQLGPRPCQDQRAKLPSFPSTWRDVTRWWYLHRAATVIVLRFCLTFAVSATLAERISSVPGGTFIVGAVVVAGLATYRTAAFRAFIEIGHPTFIIGDTVRRQALGERKILARLRLGRRRVSIPGFVRAPSARPFGPREYVFDVALEGVQLVRVNARERRPPRDDGEIQFEHRPEKLRLKDFGAVKPATPFTGCTPTCSGINWYCIENPDCYRGK